MLTPAGHFVIPCSTCPHCSLPVRPGGRARRGRVQDRSQPVTGRNPGPRAHRASLRADGGASRLPTGRLGDRRYRSRRPPARSIGARPGMRWSRMSPLTKMTNPESVQQMVRRRVRRRRLWRRVRVGAIVAARRSSWRVGPPSGSTAWWWPCASTTPPRPTAPRQRHPRPRRAPGNDDRVGPAQLRERPAQRDGDQLAGHQRDHVRDGVAHEHLPVTVHVAGLSRPGREQCQRDGASRRHPGRGHHGRRAPAAAAAAPAPRRGRPRGAGLVRALVPRRLRHHPDAGRRSRPPPPTPATRASGSRSPPRGPSSPLLVPEPLAVHLRDRRLRRGALRHRLTPAVAREVDHPLETG